MPERKEQAEKIMLSTKKWLIGICFIVAIFFIIISRILRGYQDENAFIFEMIASGFLGIVFLLLIELVVCKA